MKKNLISSHSLCTFPSPGAGNYQEKGWSSERVPHPSGSSRRHISALTPFYSGRTMPSKWEDAERWICSPVLGYGVAKYSQCQPQRRPKSKSGPIVPPGISYYSNYSPSMQVLDSASVRNFIANSPFSTGVLMPKGVGVHYNGDGIGGQAIVARSASGPGWSDLASECSSPSSQDGKLDNINDAENAVTRIISRRDMATQMSPEGSTSSSPRGRSSSPPSVSPAGQSESDHPAKLEIREVQVDKRATLISRTARHGSCTTKKGLPDIQDINENATDARISSWDVAVASSDFSKLQREEAKITAWENLQKAKAEAAIRKLEMKLEKKRSSSMDKILNRLTMAQIKAQEMRSSISDTQGHQIAKIPHKVSFFHRPARLSFLSSCFNCRTS
ncbi:hypothetical protein P3X46_018782 [Hevea brasiliensis]|uniref:Remorin C-terminal domain-containing protein n=1 Tax=Hevea brasiliensis TaxID=3981 RepID=A0ABQ9LRV5_HEVBR|nr:uncharacterized protein LOC110662925 isoform X2 [Hevea brasiliensis]KAJ9170692.1 hypothetical protein P3X46_018782 [Hevea brasiliensis]